MKRALLLLSIFFAAPLLSQGQDTNPAWRSELTEDYKILKGQIADQNEMIKGQRIIIEKLQNDLTEMRRKLDKPPGNFASPEDLKALKDALQEESKKRQADDEKILTEVSKQISKLGKVADSGMGGGAPPVTGARGNSGNSGNSGGVTPPTRPPKTDHADATPPAPKTDGPGFKYTVKENDNPQKIARKLFEEKGIKITSEEIMAVNGIKDPKKMFIGQQIFIPMPAPGMEAKINP